MRNRSAFLLFGFGLALVGYALVYSGITSLNPNLSPTGQPVATIDGLLNRTPHPYSGGPQVPYSGGKSGFKPGAGAGTGGGGGGGGGW